MKEFKFDKRIELTVRHFFVNYKKLEESVQKDVTIYLPKTDFYFGKDVYMEESESVEMMMNELGGERFKFFDSFTVSEKYYKQLKKTLSEKHTLNNYKVRDVKLGSVGEVVFFEGSEYMYLIAVDSEVLKEKKDV